MKVLIGMLLSILCPSLLAQQMDSTRNCEQIELQQTCETMKVSIGCKTIPYCIHCKWNTAFFPKEDNIGGKCAVCKYSVEQRKSASINSSENEHISFLKSICNFHEKEADKFVCSHLVENQPVRSHLWEGTKNNLSSLDICSLLGLCYSKFEINIKNAPREEFHFNSFTFRYPHEDIVSNKKAATSRESKVYRVLENGVRLNPELETTVPKFTPYSSRNEKEEGAFSKYSCDFSPLVIRDVKGSQLWIIFLILILVSFVIALYHSITKDRDVVAK